MELKMINLDSIKALPISDSLNRLTTDAFNYTRNSRHCEAISDRDFVQFGLQRIIQNKVSGRDFIQGLKDNDSTEVARATFFKALKSSRRKDLCRDIATAMEEKLSDILDELDVDYYSQFNELDDYDLIAGDGHYIEHACHTPKAVGKDKVYAAGHIFMQDLRNGLLSHYSLVSNGRSKKHEIPIFRNAFKVSTPPKKRKKRLLILDRAYIDQVWWAQAAPKGEYLITRAKENFNIMICGDLNFDRNLSVNTGVQRDYLGGIGTSSFTMRFVDYIDPETHEKYRFLTTNTELPPGLIAWLYFKRWTIEKTFDTSKNALFENKAWAISDNAHELQALFLAMAYNFMHLINAISCSELNKEEGVLYRKKYRKNIECRKKKAVNLGRSLHPFLLEITRMPKMMLQFIRALKSYFSSRRTLSWHMPALKDYLIRYL